jgi:beta-glucuronidase
MLDDKPYAVKGMTYGPNLVGLTPQTIMAGTYGPDSSGEYPHPGDVNNTTAWTWDDYNKNGLADGPFEAWADANRNEKQDKNEKNAGDFALMKAMGVNTLRIYHSKGLNKDILKTGYEKYDFMYLMGNLIGMYAIDNGVGWEKGTDYSNPVCQKAMLDSIKQMMKDFKDEPYVLAWVLGNENNYSWFGATNVQSNPEAYYKFANECAKLIKSLDPHKRPVIISNGDIGFIDYFAKYCPDIDVFGANVYRGEAGFGSFWQDVLRKLAKPALITEYGCPAYAKGWSQARREEGQASYHRGNWIDIEDNMAGVKGGSGGALGGIIFEWSDEWWKLEGDSDPNVHDEATNSDMPFMDGGGYEEWFGIAGIGDGKDSVFKRQLRKAYFAYRKLWNK